MKKLLLVAAIGAAGLVSAKGNVSATKKSEKENNTVKAPLQTCGVRIAYYSGGQVVGYKTVTSDQPTLEACQNWQTSVKVALWAQGFWLS